MRLKIVSAFIFLIAFQAHAQKYQLRPVIVQVLPLGLDMTSKFLSNESGITDSSQVAGYLMQRGGKYATSTVGMNLNVSVYVPVYKKFYVGLNYNVSNSKSNLIGNMESEDKIENEEFHDDYYLPDGNGNRNHSSYVLYISSYERKISTLGFGIMYLANNPMKGLPFIPYFKLGVNMVKTTFSDVELTKHTLFDYPSGSESIETTPMAINNFNSLSYNASLGMNVKIGQHIQYTIFEASLAQYKMSTDNVTQFSLKTGVTILISNRK